MHDIPSLLNGLLQEEIKVKFKLKNNLEKHDKVQLSIFPKSGHRYELDPTCTESTVSTAVKWATKTSRITPLSVPKRGCRHKTPYFPILQWSPDIFSKNQR